MKKYIRSLAELLFPRYCESCSQRLCMGEQMFCTSCNGSLPRRDDMLSPCDNEVARLFWGLMPLERGASWIDYVPHSGHASAIYNMKYNGRSDIAETLGRMVAMEFMPYGFFEDIDMIIPMPLHKKRERQRGYNQSREFALGLSSVAHVPLADGVVCRSRNTLSQTTMSGESRVGNVKGAFCLLRPELIAGKHVLLVDDIITTGATVASCGMELAKAENLKISCLSIGKTVD